MRIKYKKKNVVSESKEISKSKIISHFKLHVIKIIITCNIYSSSEPTKMKNLQNDLLRKRFFYSQLPQTICFSRLKQWNEESLFRIPPHDITLVYDVSLHYFSGILETGSQTKSNKKYRRFFIDIFFNGLFSDIRLKRCVPPCERYQ